MSMTIPGITDVYVPNKITVHLGKPDELAENVTVNFIDYIKNVASSELYPTWPEDAIIANIHAIVSIALNRLYTEWYRSRGYNFDITNSTQFDQSYVHDRGIFDNISLIVDEIFDDYIVIDGRLEPLFTQYCDGRITQCEGMYQWGTVDLAKQGYIPIEILKYYYGDDIKLITDATVGDPGETYPGTPIKLGDKGIYPLIVQVTINIISTNYPIIPKINPPDGVFGSTTEEAVKVFQQTFNLPITGIVDKGTWYKARSIYVAVKRLAELTSVGVLLIDIPEYLEQPIVEGVPNARIQLLQYFFNVLSTYYDTIPDVDINGILDPNTRVAIIEFQKTVGLPETGEIDDETWEKLFNTMLGIIINLPPTVVFLPKILFPGENLKLGDESPNVLLIQLYLALISSTIKDITFIPYDLVDGVFGPITESAVIAFQETFNIPVTGVIDERTWNRIVEIYRDFKYANIRFSGQFPGENISITE